ncbi:MAG: hypothetical protein IJW28_05575, partial [Clostridia bacterium]|nr:hypothetical protein [Clostridia bacterium]
KKCDNRVIKEAITDKLDTKIKDICSLVYKELRLCGVVRFDYILDKDGVLYLNELNTIPGSMANYLYSNRGINYDEMCQMMFREGVREFTNNKKLNITYNSPVLNKINSLKFNK